MSTIVCLTEKNTLILATDSRFMKLDFSGPESDTEQKIFEIAPQAFIAASGRKMVCEFQRARARELASEMGESDIRSIGKALARESFACMAIAVETMRAHEHVHEGIGEALRGECLLHGCVLAGRTSEGRLGYVSQSYWLRAGAVVCEVEEYFDDHRKIHFTLGDNRQLRPGILPFLQDLAIWIDPPARVVERILAEIKQTTPVTGGPNQIVCIDGEGARWISPPPTAAVPLSGDLLTATISAAINMTSPSLTITGTGGAFVANIDASNAVKVSNTSGTVFAQVTAGQVAIYSSGIPICTLTDGGGPNGFAVFRGPSGTMACQIGASGDNGVLAINGNQVVGPRQAGPGNPSFASLANAQTWCQNLLNALQDHGLVT